VDLGGIELRNDPRRGDRGEKTQYQNQ